MTGRLVLKVEGMVEIPSPTKTSSPITIPGRGGRGAMGGAMGGGGGGSGGGGGGGGRAASRPIGIPGRMGDDGTNILSSTPTSLMQSEMLSTSPGSGWQKLLPEQMVGSPSRSLIPPRPMPPACVLATGENNGDVRVSWEDGPVVGKATGVSYCLAGDSSIY